MILIKVDDFEIKGVAAYRLIIGRMSIDIVNLGISYFNSESDLKMRWESNDWEKVPWE